MGARSLDSILMGDSMAASVRPICPSCGRVVPRPRGRPKRSPIATDREAQMIVMRESGSKLEEIGAAFGVTRERARQLLKRNGVTRSVPRTDADPVRLVAAIRLPTTLNVHDAVDALGADRSACNRVLRQLGMAEAVRRLLRWRRDQRVIVRFIALSRSLGHTATVRDCERGGLRQSDIQRLFGGLQRLATRAGLAPNGTGMRVTTYTRHNKAPRKTHCLHGHEFTPDNSLFAGARKQRVCRTCHRARKRAQYAKKRALSLSPQTPPHTEGERAAPLLPPDGTADARPVASCWCKGAPSSVDARLHAPGCWSATRLPHQEDT